LKSTLSVTAAPFSPWHIAAIADVAALFFWSARYHAASAGKSTQKEHLMQSAAKWLATAVVGGALLGVGRSVEAQDWSQWRGDHRDGKAEEFSAPATWPKELTKKWEVVIGDGVSTPSLVGDRLYVFSRQEGNEIARCLDAATGKEVWKDSYASDGTTGGASGFQGPRCSPTVVDGKVVTLGVRGILSCLDAKSGKVLWRKDPFPGKWPMFYTSSSPVVVDGLCIAQLGGQGEGGIVAFDMGSGEEKWRWTGEGPSNGSPVVMSFDDTNVVIAPTEQSLVGVRASDGKELWKIQYTQDRGTSATPMVEGETLVLAGPGSGITAIGLKLEGDALEEEELWKNTDNSVRFNTPTIADGALFGLSNSNSLFCIKMDSHETAWSKALGGATPPGGGPFGPGGPGGRGRGPGGPDGGGGPGERPRGEERPIDGAGATHDLDLKVRFVATTGNLLAQAASEPPAEAQPAQPTDGAQPQAEGQRRGDGEGRRGGRGRGGRGGRGGGGGYGSIVDAGSVLLITTPASELVVFEPSAAEFKEIARYKVAATPIYAYPVASGKRIFTKDQDNVVLWTVE
jgi:outer membrane protein assembly factor BamB